MFQPSSQRAALQQPSASDIPQSQSTASDLTGALPRKKQRYSPFDRLGSRQWQGQKGKPSNSYAQ